jgi:hypothetical protein
MVKVYHIVFNESLYCFPHVINLRELDEQRNEVSKLPVFWIVIPRNNRHGLFWLQHVGTWRVI